MSETVVEDGEYPGEESGEVELVELAATGLGCGEEAAGGGGVQHV